MATTDASAQPAPGLNRGAVVVGRTVGRPRRCIVVVGMHRSGTSALTRVLGLLGAALPRNPIPAGADNETGFWEPRRIVELHEGVLRDIGSGWDDVLPVPGEWFSSPEAREARERLAGIVRDEYAEAPLFALKDPRMCRLLPLWTGVLADVGAEPAFVHVVRNPLEVSSSLLARNRIPPARSLLLWIGHLLAAERATRGARRVFVRYGELLDAPRETVERVGRELGIAWPREPALAIGEIEAFLQPRHRHHTVPDRAVTEDRSLPSWIGEVLALLAPVTTERDRRAGFDRLHSRYLEGSAAFGPLLAIGEAEARAAQARCGALERGIEELQGSRVALEDRVAALQASVRALEGERSARAAAAEGLERSRAAAEAEAADLRAELEQRDARIRRLRSLAQRAPWPVVWLRALRDLPLVLRSGLFDAGYYRRENADVRPSPLPAVLHFLCRGARQGRNPGPGFSVSRYEEAHPDVADAGVNPLVHYLRHGAVEGREPPRAARPAAERGADHPR